MVSVSQLRNYKKFPHFAPFSPRHVKRMDLYQSRRGSLGLRKQRAFNWAELELAWPLAVKKKKKNGNSPGLRVFIEWITIVLVRLNSF